MARTKQSARRVARRPIGSFTDSDETEDYPMGDGPSGTICDVQHLYRTKPDELGRTTWTKELPETLAQPVENDQSAQYALVVRHVKCYDGRKSLSVHSVIVQSEPLKIFLGKVLDGYPGVTTSLRRLELTQPFEPLVHRWENLVKAREEEELDQTTKDHVDLFYNILEEELRDTLAQRNDLIRNGVVTHALLWALFEPNDVVISSSDSPRGYIFVQADVEVQSQSWLVTCKHIDYNGKKFGYMDERFTVKSFVGTQPITSLPVYPLKYHPEKDAVRESLIAQGQRWEEYKGYHYRQYEGIALGSSQRGGEPKQYHVKSRIIIDAEAFDIFCSHSPVPLYDDKDMPEELTNDLRMITSNMVRGYSLNDKHWLLFYLHGTSKIDFNTDAFESLVLPREQEGLKDLLLAIAKAQSKQLDTFDDVVRGKGRGIVLQLSGPPGVGKTLTAESVAEAMQVPLYAMSAGDLGSHAEDVEGHLKDILRMVPKWGAVLLLDEADVFMETRSSTDLERNELVSIFLRMLEYYEGILFLTTNRAEHIDPAFESRIHLSLTYKELDATSRRHVWSQFLGRSANPASFSDEELDQLAEVPLNGQQIKNTIKTASLLAGSQQKELNFQQVQVVLNLRYTNAR